MSIMIQRCGLCAGNPGPSAILAWNDPESGAVGDPDSAPSGHKTNFFAQRAISVASRVPEVAAVAAAAIVRSGVLARKAVVSSGRAPDRQAEHPIVTLSD
jgi:hypothetical protein